LTEVFHECGWQLADDLPYFGSRCCLFGIHSMKWLGRFYHKPYFDAIK
jgi:hypothetical protein